MGKEPKKRQNSRGQGLSEKNVCVHLLRREKKESPATREGEKGAILAGLQTGGKRKMTV